MPTYEYECSACGHVFEALQSITEAKLSVCPECKAPRLSRLIGSGSGVIFKGTGFYETDYKKKTVPDSAKKPAETPACSSCPMKDSGGCSSV